MPLPKRVVEPVRVTRNIKILQKSSSNTPNVLETTINGTLVNTLCQLSNLSKQAEDLFDELINEIHSITVRSNSLRINLDRLSAKTHLLNNNRTNEKVSLQDIEMIKPFKSAVVFDHEILSRNTMPAKLLEMYSKCDKTPLLNKIDHYRVDGKESMKFYSDPNFFFDQWRLEISKDTEILRQDSIRRCYRLNTEGAACIRRPINSRNRKEQLAIEKGEYIMSQDAYRFWAFRQITDTFYNHPIRQNDYQFAKSMDVILSKFGIRGGDAEKSKETHSLSKNNNSSDSCLVKNVTSGQKLSFKKLSNPNKNFPFYTKPLLPAEITVSRVSFSHSTTIPPPSSLPLILDRPPSPKQKMPLVSKCSPLQSDQMAFIKSLPTISDTLATLTNEVQKPLARQNDSPHHLIQCITNETDDSCARARITPEAGHILDDNENTDILRDIKDGVELSGVDIIQQKEQERSDDFDSNSSYYRNIEITDSDSDFPLSIKCDSDDSWSDESYTRSHDVLSTDSLTTLTSECSWSSSHEALSIPSPSLIENNFYFIEPFPERFPSQRSVSIKSHLPLENFPPPPPPSFLLMLDSLMALANKPSKSSSKQKLSSNHVTQSEPTFDEEPLTNINDGDLRTFDNIGHVAHTEILPPPFAYRSSPTSLESIRNASELSSMFTTLNNEDITSLPEQRFHNHVVQSEPIIDLNTTLTWNNISSIDERNNSEFQSLTTRAEFLPQPPSMFDTRSVVNDGVIISPPEQYLPNRTIQSEPNINVNTTVTNISSNDVRETPGTDCFAELEELLSSLTPLPRTSSSSTLENVFHPLSLPPSMFDTPTMSSNDDIILPPVEYLSDPITQSESTLRDANTTVTNISSSGVRKTLSLDDLAELTELLSSLTSLPRTSSSSSLPSVFDTPTMSSNENIVAPQVECLSDRISQSESTQRDVNTIVTNISSNDLRETPGTDHFAEFTELLSSFTPLPRTSSSSSLPSMFDMPTMSSNDDIIPPPVECLSDRISQSESTQRDMNTTATNISSNDLRETPGTDHFAEFTELLSSFTPLPRTSSSSSLPSVFDTPTMSSNENIVAPQVECLSDRISQSESTQRDVNTIVTNISSNDLRETPGTDHFAEFTELLSSFTPLPRTSSSSSLPSMFDMPTMSSNDDIIPPPVECLSDRISQSESTQRDMNTTATNISSNDLRETPGTDHFAEFTELLSSFTPLPRTSSSSSLPSVFDTPTMSSNENIVAPQVEYLSDRISQSESTQRDMNTTATNISSNDLRQTPGTDHFAEFTELLSSFTPLLRTSSSSSLPSVFDTPTMSSNENKVSPQVECLSDRITQSESTQRDVNTIVTNISSNDLRETPGTDHFAEFTELLSSFTPLPRTSSSSSLPSMFDTPTMSSNDDNIIPPPVEYLSDRITQSESSQRDAITTVTNTNSSDVTKTLGLDDLSLHIGLLEAFLDGVKIKDFEKLKF